MAALKDELMGARARVNELEDLVQVFFILFLEKEWGVGEEG